MVGFLASALRAPAPKPTKCDTIPSAYLFSRKWFTSIDITEKNYQKIKISLDISENLHIIIVRFGNRQRIAHDSGFV